MSSSFVKQEIFQKAGQLSFNVVRVVNRSDTAVRIKPNFITPGGWGQISLPYHDTIVPPRDSISLSFRFKLPNQLSAEQTHVIYFRAYTLKNKMITECSFDVQSEPFHDWELILPDRRVFFYPRMNLASFSIDLRNKGNTTEVINLKLVTDKKIALTSGLDWEKGQPITLEPYQDTTLTYFVRYTYSKDRVFDISRVTILAGTDLKDAQRILLIEKYSDIFAPLYIDKDLPHQTDVGFRTFSGNRSFLPFIKARGTTTFANESKFRYNFNYYAQTGNEDILGNMYYNFTYDWQSFRVGIGAFSSQLGRNLYTRNGIMVSNTVQLSPRFALEAMVSQSFFMPKTSAGVGYTINTKKTKFFGSVAYDFDNDKKVNTASVMFQSGLIPLFTNHDLSFSLYGYSENHYLNNEYTMTGFAWDINYLARIGERVSFKISNNYGSPDIPGTQMGLLTFSFSPVFIIGSKRNFISLVYNNSSRNYYAYSYEGFKLPEVRLYNQYGNFMFYYNANARFSLAAGPSVEYYQSLRPSVTYEGILEEFTSEKFRFEIKSVILRNLTLNIKAGVSNNTLRDVTVTTDRRYDFHLLGGYSIGNGYGVSFGYDYGPMVNSGLYQFASDAKNHSLNFGPTMMTSFFKERISFNLFANLAYRFDLKFASVNVNPRIEAYLFRDWYAVMSGTYHFTQQQYENITAQNSHTYFEFAIRKRWGKSDFNKWQKDTRRLKIVLFKDDNGNGQKDEFEQGMPYVKTRVKLTNSDNPVVRTDFPVDVTLLSNEAGLAIYNRLPMGFYDLAITPLEDVKEYFFVDRSLEKIELTQNTTVYVPFQKASKITGKINLKRQQFIKKGEEAVDLKNIRITAYNTQGNSFSSFTLEDGSFIIFVPNNITYFVRMGNVFGDNYRIAQNDILVSVSDTTTGQVVFNVSEIGRQVKFKTAGTAKPDTLQPEELKVKVLHGKIYENTGEEAVDPNATPGFNIPVAPAVEQKIIPDLYYVIIGDATFREEALNYLKIVRENGINAYLGHHEQTDTWVVYTNYYQSKAEAQKEVSLLKKPGLRAVRVVKF